MTRALAIVEWLDTTAPWWAWLLVIGGLVSLGVTGWVVGLAVKGWRED